MANAISPRSNNSVTTTSTNSSPESESLSLAYKNLTEIPSYVWEQHQLKKLLLGGNMITTIPVECTNLTELRVLNATCCQISSFPFSDLHKLSNLTLLSLSQNKISALGRPQEQMLSLAELDVSGNLIPEVPDGIEQFAHLSILRMSRCNINRISSMITRLTVLKELTLSENKLSTIPPFLYSLSSLEILDLSKNIISSISPDVEDDPVANAPWPKLRILQISDNLITHIAPNTLSIYTSLEVLNLSFNKITDVSSDLSRLERLTSLNLSANQILQIPVEFEQLINLNFLDVSYNDITNIPDCLENIPALKFLCISGNNIAELPDVCTRLQTKGVQVRANNSINIPSEILPGLYLGSVAAARDKHTLQRLGVKSILTVCEFSPFHEGSFVYKVINIDDHEGEDIGQHFVACHEYIVESLKSGGVLVHCAAGISRSASMVIFHVMKVQQMSMEEAFAFVKSKRPIICPNSGFREQLLAFESKNLESPRKEKCALM